MSRRHREQWAWDFLATAVALFAACSNQPVRSGSSGTGTSSSSRGSGGDSGSGSTGAASTGGSTLGTSVTTGSGGTGATGSHSGGSGSTGGSACGFEGAGCTLPSLGDGLCCGGTCTDPTADDGNCSSCGLQCPSGTHCSAGACEAPNCDGQPLGTPCLGNEGSNDPSETCASLSGVTDICLGVVASCGAGTADEVCPLGDGGSGSGLCCGASCADLQNDPSNCGQCGLSCAQGASCADGSCSWACAVGICAANQACVQTGSFGGSSCVPAKCASSAVGSACAFEADAGVGGVCCAAGCVNTLSDPDNCGLCAHACASGEYCNAGSCQPAVDCGAQQYTGHPCGVPGGGDGVCCGGSCQVLDVFSDPMNCGGCARACPVNAVCVSQSCDAPGGQAAVSCEEPGLSCPAGYTCSGYGGSCLLSACGAQQDFDSCNFADDPNDLGTCCGSNCVDPLTDRDNCGQCGWACGAGTFCKQGLCVPNQACSPQQDGPSCPLDAGGDGACCQGSCANLRVDPTSCGACGLACPLGEPCVLGRCLVPDGGSGCGTAGCPEGLLCLTANACYASGCPPGEDGLACPTGTCCDGTCAALASDPSNCGACGNVCASGVCFESLCLPPPSGPCGIDCGQQGLACVDGQCLPTSCAGAIGECVFGGQSTGVCCAELSIGGTPSAQCTNVLADPTNCGGCAIACPAGQSCVAGACSGDVAPCLAGSGGRLCDIDAGPNWACCPGAGCTDLTSDPNNCGSCGAACLADEGCFAFDFGGPPVGGCLATSCTAATAYLFCSLDGGTTEGICCNDACLDTANDPDNCGDCFIQCDGGSCVQGVCQ